MNVPATFLTRTGAVWGVREVTAQEAADRGCPDATHVLTGRTGQVWARWTATSGRLVAMPHRGWAPRGRCAVHGTFTAWFNAGAQTALPGHLTVR